MCGGRGAQGSTAADAPKSAAAIAQSAIGPVLIIRLQGP
jgi:hypothetical protein